MLYAVTYDSGFFVTEDGGGGFDAVTGDGVQIGAADGGQFDFDEEGAGVEVGPTADRAYVRRGLHKVAKHGGRGEDVAHRQPTISLVQFKPAVNTTGY